VDGRLVSGIARDRDAGTVGDCFLGRLLVDVERGDGEAVAQERARDRPAHAEPATDHHGSTGRRTHHGRHPDDASTERAGWGIECVSVGMDPRCPHPGPVDGPEAPASIPSATSRVKGRVYDPEGEPEWRVTRALAMFGRWIRPDRGPQ